MPSSSRWSKKISPPPFRDLMSTFQIHCEHPGPESILGRFDKVMPDTGEARKCDDMTDLRPAAHISQGLAIICTTPTKLPPYFHGSSRPPELFTVVHDRRGIHLVVCPFRFYTFHLLISFCRLPFLYTPFWQIKNHDVARDRSRVGGQR
ncbi:hypothetical protein B0H13DRAFT_2261447 [Mycena leptocephala]|nr:hypothetical protein B0H13DRAFT_2261447 [Mycena leptocephala]